MAALPEGRRSNVGARKSPFGLAEITATHS
jgi:hypothetical protein